MTSQSYSFKSKVWLYEGPQASWHFITLSEEQSDEIRVVNADRKKGWGSIPVKASIGKTTWRTSIFPYKKVSAYILPLKADVRKNEKIKEGSTVSVTLEIGA